MSRPVILGAGLAGLSVALGLAPMPVIVISPTSLGEGCSSAWAQGGIAAAVGAEDCAAFHAADTMTAGAGLNDTETVKQVTEDGIAVIERLAARGVAFDRTTDGKLRLGLEAAHGKRRIVHAADATGAAVMEAMIATARTTPSIEIIENAIATDIIAEDGVAGIVLQRGGEQVLINTNRVVLATGGAAALWRDTTNPHGNWGSGLVLAARTGATLADLEFVQFHPTAIDAGLDPMPLASEAVRGEGATLIDEDGARFVEELQPRDIVARAIYAKICEGRRVFLDARAIGETFARRFPTIHTACLAAGIDPAQMPIPVRPAAHYHMGGVRTDARGRTDVTGLWACGEAACTGLHGANRLASNSLLEAASFGQRVADDIKGFAASAMPALAARLEKPPRENEATTIRAIMAEHVGVARSRNGLERAVRELGARARRSDMALAGLMIAVSALRREESRGAHYRTDFPETAPDAKRSFMRFEDIKELL
ncbi:MAG: L-aspartate oxidase [Alphaproteobacteria bacterium]|nr:L-aspartate oxidase [Alphaproteobacteria bacterium]